MQREFPALDILVQHFSLATVADFIARRDEVRAFAGEDAAHETDRAPATMRSSPEPDAYKWRAVARVEQAIAAVVAP